VRRRLLAATAALVLLLAGTVVLVAYVRGADARALAGTRTVEVLVADQPIPEGTSGDALADLVRTEALPEKAAVAGRVTDLAALADQVATVDIQPGEQLLAGRFARPESLQAPGTVAVPAGKQELSVLLEPQRAVGSRLQAGDTVGVYVSLTLADGRAATHAVLHKVLVTQVQGAPAQPDAKAAQGEPDTASSSSGGAAPTSNVLVTLAVSAQQAEAVVFGVEHGQLWLSLEPQDAATGGTDVITQENIYGKAFA
jgi:pilus assembly protein CpaB